MCKCFKVNTVLISRVDNRDISPCHSPSETIRLCISCELSAGQTIHMQCQALFSLKLKY